MIPPKIIRPRPSFPAPRRWIMTSCLEREKSQRLFMRFFCWEGGGGGKEREDNDASSTSSSTLRMTKGSGSEGWLKSPEINTSLVEILSELVKRIELKKILPWQGQRISQPKQFGHLFFSQQIFNSISYDSKYYWVHTKSSTGSQLPT